MMTDDGRLRGGDGTVDKRRRARLATLVRQFVEAESWAASRVFAERHPELLSSDTDAVLTWLRDAARAALACDPPESARPVLASTLAGLYLGRYECDGALDDLRSAIDVARAGGGAAPRLERAALLVIHAVALDRYAEHVRAPGMRDEAAALLAKAARLLPRGSSELLAEELSLGQLDMTRLSVTCPELASRYAAVAGRVRGLDAAARSERSGLALGPRPDGQPG
jgi:hypothetical protein